MIFVILTLFPDMFPALLGSGIVRKAASEGKIVCNTLNIRDFADGRHRVTDDRPYGGGCGMVMKPEPLARAIRAAKSAHPTAWTLLLSPQGRTLKQDVANELCRHDGLILVCGRYEGVDERVRQHLVTDEISIGDYVLTGGELAAMVIIDAVTRLLPGVLGHPGAALDDSHASGLLEGPQYTRPAVFRGWEVPEVLRSGNHAAVARWRREQALRRTFERRPDLPVRADLTSHEKELLARWEEEISSSSS